jgi:DNA (cytosine-5)-methyltransferase 1
MADGVKHALVAAFLARHYGGHENDGAPLQLSLPTVTARDHHALVTSHLLKLRGGLPRNTARTVTRADADRHRAAGTHIAEVRAFLVKYYGTDQDPQLGLPLATVTTKDRFGLVTVHGEDYAIADICMRMLSPRELFNATRASRAST